ncbi:Fc receptor-like protein 3 [Zonotrichia leucophrys gambelii]|uniref:Fc receptor-like protein 3 n=1 Tax=Zonotrichia leucophrys gambelii TaxID=257770 RepID=UPI003140636C
MDFGHLGTYQCMAKNQLGVFRALSPELAMELPQRTRKEEGEVLYTHVVVTKKAGRRLLLVLEIILCLCHVATVLHWLARKAELEQRLRWERLEQSRQPGEQWPQQRVTASAHGWGHRDGREAQTLGLTGTQTTQLLVEPPWRPAVLWDRVTLTCQGLGTSGVTSWYKDGQRWRQEGHNNLTVTESGIYTCERPSSGLSPPVRVLDAPLALQVPVRALLEEDTVTLRCRHWRDNPVSSVSFYHEEKKLQELLDATELFLSPLHLQHSGRYSCGSMVKSRVPWGWEKSESVTVTVQELFTVPVLDGPSEATEGSPLTLSCLSTPSPVRPQPPLLHLFYRDGQVVGSPQGSLQLLVPAMEVSHSGNYSCQVRSEVEAMQKSSALLHVTVRMPVANATITLSPLSHQVRAALRKQQERGPPWPSAPPEAREVLHSQVMRKKKVGVPPCATSSQVTNAELPGPHGQQQDCSDIYENIL